MKNSYMELVYKNVFISFFTHPKNTKYQPLALADFDIVLSCFSGGDVHIICSLGTKIIGS